MSTDPSSAPQDPNLAGSAAAQPPASTAAQSPVTQGAEAADDAGQENRAARIKIGTQRPGVAIPRIEPRAKVAFRTQPSETPAQNSPGGETSVEKPQTESAQPAANPPPQRPLEPKPYTFKPKSSKPRFEVPHVPAEKVELPSLRDDLPPEMEAELQAALGNQSVEELISSSAMSSAGVSEAIEPDTRMQARVARIFRDDVFVDLGGRNQGVLPLHSFAKEPAVGTMLDVVVTKFNSDESLYELTAPGMSVDVADWSDITEGMVVDAHVTGHNKGGLECEVNKIRGFIPAGQVSVYRVENLEEFVGQRWPCVVMESNPQRRNLVLSRRAMLEREQAAAKEQLLAQLEVGQTREGIVRTLRDFGAFVDLGGIDGLVHVSQMSWDRVKHPSEVLSVGQKVKVKIQKIDPQTHKISLAYRDLFENPWDKVASKYPVTSKIKGTVSKIMDFGAFVKLEPGVEGLVHISELSHKRVFRANDVVQEGQEIEAKVLSVDTENQRISLSMKALEARPEPTKKSDEPEEAAESAAPSAPKKERKVPLKGGLGKSTFGEKFGLKW